MFDFIFNPGVNNLIPETNRYSHTLRMRMQKNKVKQAYYIPEGPDDPVFSQAKSILNMH